MTSEVPELLGGRYELGALLGRGGMAEVRRARDTRLGREVAVKRLRVDLAGDSTFQARFRREAQSAAGLNHPNIVSVYDTGEEPDPVTGISVPYIVMELVEGHTLRDILRQGRKILPERALELTQGVLDALDYSHRAGIIHRDIKPANVMLTPQGQVKVMDFGIARAVADTSATMTQTAAVIGTAQYLSPEQARGEKVDARSDIYSTGCLLYELLVGRPPFVGDSPVSVAYQHVREEPVPPSELDNLVTPEIDGIVLTSLAKDPEHRYQSARDMRDDIVRLLRGEETTRVAPPPVPAPAPEPAPTQQLGVLPTDSEPVEEEEEDEDKPRRTGLWVTLIVATLLLIAGVGGIFWWMNSTPKEPEVVMVTMPSVIGQTQEQATNTLEGQGFAVTVEQVRGEDDSSVGQVVDQDPPGNKQVPEKSDVTITVNIGPEKATIPSGLIGGRCKVATDELTKLGLKVDRKDASEEPLEANKDDLLSIEPGEGEQVTKGQSVTITCAKGTIRVPNWYGKTRQDVEREAGENRLKVAFSEEESDAPAGTVVSTDPGANTEVGKDTEVKVTLAKKPEPTTDPTPTEEPTPTEDPSPTEEPSPTDGPPNGNNGNGNG